MKTTKLLITLKKSSEKELQQFQNWINSPFHNKNEKAKQLYVYLLKFAPNFDNDKLEKRLIFKKLYGKEAYNELKINNIISVLTRQLFDFLAYQNFQNSNNLSKICLMDELLKRDLDKLVMQEGRRLKKEKTQSLEEHASTFFENYLYYKQLDEVFLKKPKRIYDENLQQKNDSLDLFYIITKLKIASDMASRNTVIQANYESHHLEDLEKWIENNDFNYKNYPALAVHHQVLRTIKSGKETDYKILKSLLQANLSIFSKEEITKLYDYVLNFCIRQINQGKSTFYQEILDIYKFLLENQIIFQNGYLAQWDYKNIITVGTRLGEIQWTETFILAYKKHLPPTVRENAFIYNLAAFYYTTKAYKKSLQLLHEVKFTDSSYHLGAKIIQLKSFYELEETESFYALTDAFKVYLLRRKDISTYRKQANLNLIKFAKRIFKLKENKYFLSPSIFNQKWNSIHKRLEKTENVANKNWLKECLEQLVS